MAGCARRVFATALLSVGLLCWGCRSGEAPSATTRPDDKPTDAAAVPDWSREQACALLGDDKLGIRAALRLVQLAGLNPLCMPARVDAEHCRRLRLVRLHDGCWALGLADPHDAALLRAPLLISAAGAVTQLAEGAAEEGLTLYVSQDGEVFPHLLIHPDQVVLVAEKREPAIVLEGPPTTWFALRRERGFPYIALLADGGVEVARYVWDPYEQAFAGPATDKLLDRPGESFHIDLKSSRRLIPVGGEIPAPPEEEPEDEPNTPQPIEDWDAAGVWRLGVPAV